jgi:hypothetical protein
MTGTENIQKNLSEKIWCTDMQEKAEKEPGNDGETPPRAFGPGGNRL